MAADQLRKRLNANNLVNSTSREQYSGKKKKLGFPEGNLNLRSNISLEWDDNNKTVVAKKEQVGISWRDMVPFVDTLSPFYSNLADVFTVPREIFEFEDLVNILSFEVWQTQLSECQRSTLSQFLPKGVEPDYAVQKLLVGDNFHFGNPFMKWSSSICFGKFHPDVVLDREQSIKASKTAYYSEFHKYHGNMIENLQAWKERWAACQDPEVEIVQKIWGSRKNTGHGMQYPESNYCSPECNEVSTPESCSWATTEKACRSDNSPISAVVPGEPQIRKVYSASRVDDSLDMHKEHAKLKRGENSLKQSIECGDGAKYLSYIKVSKELHQRVKSMLKHTSSSIQSRSINNVLGNLDAFHVQPLEIFEKEERQKLERYWLQLVNKDMLAGFANWSRRKLEACQLTKSLCREIEENLKLQEQLAVQDEVDYIQPELTDNREAEVSLAPEKEDKERSYPDTLIQDQVGGRVTEEESATSTIEDEEMKKSNYIIQGQLHNATANTEDGDCVPHFNEDQRLENIGPVSSDLQDNTMNLDSHDNEAVTRANDLPPSVTKFPGNINHVNIPVSQGDRHGSADDVWSVVSVPGTYYHSSPLSHGYVSSSELSNAHAQVIEERPAHAIDLEVDGQGKPSRRELLHVQFNDMAYCSSYTNQGQIQGKYSGREVLHRQPEDVSFFGSYASHDRNELFESFLKSQDGLVYDHGKKRMGLDFQQSDNLMIGTGQFPGHFRDPADVSQPLDARHKRINDIYMDQSIQGSAYSGEGRYSTPRHLPANNFQDWGVVNTQTLPPSQSYLNDEDLMSYNWFPAENRGRTGWSSLQGIFCPSRSIGSVSHSDQSLFSVLSECNELCNGAHYDSLGSGGRLMQAGANSFAGGIPCTSSILQQTGNPLNYLSRQQEATAGQKTTNIGWMGMPHQNSGLQESTGKPFVGSWNQ